MPVPPACKVLIIRGGTGGFACRSGFRQLLPRMPSTLRNSMHGPGRPPGRLRWKRWQTGGKRRQAIQPACTQTEESDRGEVPKSRSNNEAQAEAESEEGRPRIKENASLTHTNPPHNGERVSQGLPGVRQAEATEERKVYCAALHHLTEALRVIASTD